MLYTLSTIPCFISSLLTLYFSANANLNASAKVAFDFVPTILSRIALE
ncbi:uncharacterized protein METZ01_LOCUS222448 [marine metagenome]|uniref:Uncharacterized protein n=1 Tax=marine metagenome TaxID=408172 RepID=A0A382G4Q4_9ZZZZ